MRLASLGVRNVMRSRFRTIMTVLGVAVAIMAFVMLRTVLSAWTVAADFAAKDRVVTRHKVGSSRVDLQACKLEYSIVSPK